jgi:hypothetical protein
MFFFVAVDGDSQLWFRELNCRLLASYLAILGELNGNRPGT